MKALDFGIVVRMSIRFRVKHITRVKRNSDDTKRKNQLMESRFLNAFMGGTDGSSVEEIG